MAGLIERYQTLLRAEELRPTPNRQAPPHAWPGCRMNWKRHKQAVS
jgi:hypothetical protein